MKRLDIEKTRCAAIVVQPRLRTPSPDAVNAMAASMSEIGLICPIGVRVVAEMEVYGEISCGVPVLIYGATRLAAARQLGWSHIDTQIVEADDIDASLAEIDENLARHELTTDEKREHLRRRKELWEQRQTVNGKSFPINKAAGQGVKGFAEETAEATGLTKRRINQLLADPKPKPAPEERPYSAKLAEPLNDFEIVQKQVDALMAAWNKAGPEAREEFRARIDGAVFDQTSAAA